MIARWSELTWQSQELVPVDGIADAPLPLGQTRSPGRGLNEDYAPLRLACIPLRHQKNPAGVQADVAHCALLSTQSILERHRHPRPHPSMARRKMSLLFTTIS
jgi:hypothetical protein